MEYYVFVMLENHFSWGWDFPAPQLINLRASMNDGLSKTVFVMLEETFSWGWDFPAPRLVNLEASMDDQWNIMVSSCWKQS